MTTMMLVMSVLRVTTFHLSIRTSRIRFIMEAAGPKKSSFMEGIVKYKNDWKRIQMNTRTRSSTQVRSHAQKFFLMCKKALSLRKGALVEYDTKKTINNIFDSVFKRNDCTPNDDFYICIEQMIFNTDKHRTNTRGSVRCKRKSSDTQVIEDDDISQGKVQMIFNSTHIDEKK